MTESHDGVYAHNATRDCSEQDMVYDRLYLRKHNHGIRKRKTYSRLHF